MVAPASSGLIDPTGTPDIPDPRQALESAMAIPDIQDLVAGALAAVDARSWAGDVRRGAGAVAASSRRSGALANAAFEGAGLPAAALAAASAADLASPMGRVVGAALDLATQSGPLTEVICRAPLQALAQAGTIVGRGFLAPDDLGRPRRTDNCDDPLHLPGLPAAAGVSRSLVSLGQVLVDPEPRAVPLAAVAHAHLALLRPFEWGSGLVARASTRWILAARGVDVDMFCVPEAGFLAVGRTRYVRGIAGYRSSTATGLQAWFAVFTEALRAGAEAGA